MADPKHPRRFGEGLKRQIAQPCDGGKGAAEVKAEHGIGHPALHRWVRSIHENGSTRAADTARPRRAA